jgi:hypothetical protein
MPQTTSVSTAAGGVVYWRGGSLPSGAGALTMWARAADWSGGITLQEFLGVRVAGGDTAKFRLNRSSGDIEVNESAGGATTQVSGSNTDWAFYAFRFDGSVWEAIRSAVGSSSLNKTTLTSLGSDVFDEIVVLQPDNVYDVRVCTVRLLDGTVTDSDLLTLKASDVELSPGSATSVGFWPFDSHTSPQTDESSTAVDLGIYWATSSPTTVSDTPYSSSISGASATTQGDNTASATATALVSASCASTQGDNTASGTAAALVSVTSTTTQGANTAAGAATVAVAGSCASTQGANTVSAAATVAISASLASTQGDNTVSATATIDSSERFAESATTQGDNTVSATATVLIRAQAAITQGDNTVSASTSPIDDVTPAVGVLYMLPVASGVLASSPVALGVLS